MSIQSIIQELGPIANVLNVVVIGIGYYFLVKLYREWLRQSQESRVAGGRPMVVVNADYSHLPGISVVVRNYAISPKPPPKTSHSTSRCP